MKEVEYCYFRDVFPIRMGKTPPRGDDSSWDKKKLTNNYWVSVADITKNEGKYITDTKEYISDSAAKKIYKVKANSLLMSFKLTIGKMAFAGVDLYTNEAIIAIPKNEKYDLRFLYYYLSSYDWKTLTEGNEKVKGATLNKTSIGKIKLPIISISEQEKIVSFLDAEFVKIDALKANAASQLQAAKDLFQSALKEMLTPKEGWEEKELGKICDILDSKRKPITKNKRTSGTIPYYGATGILDYVKDFIFDEKLVLLGEDGAKWGTGENSAYIICGKSWVNNHAHALRPHRNIILDEFLVYYLNYSDLSESITGVTVPKLNQEKMRAIAVPFPSLPEQERISARLDAISEKVKALQANYDQTITLCNDLKQSLLKSIFE